MRQEVKGGGKEAGPVRMKNGRRRREERRKRRRRWETGM